jgi:uncharacterized protein (DUF2147 family)
MLMKYSLKIALLLALLFTTRTSLFAQTQQDPIERNLWYNTEKTSKIQIYKAGDGLFYGKIVWLKVPAIDGQPKLDPNNPDKSKRNTPLLGMVIIKGLKKDGDHDYVDGTIYDPKNGKTYSSKISFKEGQLDVRGYVGISLIGRTATWTKAD